VLGVKRTWSQAKIDAAYKALLAQHHPDRNPQDRADVIAYLKSPT
jgi:DnaJ-class molecular chaperone